MPRVFQCRTLGGQIAGGGSGTPPVGATLVLVDQMDGTGATATIGGAAGYSNDVVVYSLAGNVIGTFSRSGNGTVDLVLAVGAYTAELVSDDFATGNVDYFRVTGDPTDAEGSPSIAEEALRVTLANCTEFQSMLGVADEAGALAKIHVHALPPPSDGEAYQDGEEEAYRPFAIIFTRPFGNGHTWRRVATETWRDSGQIMIMLELKPPTNLARNEGALNRYWLNRIGLIEKGNPDSGTYGLLDLAHTSPDEDHQYLAIDSISLEEYFRCDDDDDGTKGDHLVAILAVHWGGR